MKRENTKNLFFAITLLLTFVLWTILVKYIDTKAIGPNESIVGLATINALFHNLTGTNMTLYTITDWLGLVPIFMGFAFFILGLIQCIKRKNIFKVDYNILTLGAFYLVVISVYILFENVVINHRPVLIDGYLEISYPSSTTMLVMTVIPTAIMQLNNYIKNKIFKKIITISFTTFTVFMVVGRLLSGVHWLSDIIGGGLFSFGLVMLYWYVLNLKEKT